MTTMLLALGFAPAAEASPSCRTYCSYGVCGPCTLGTFEYDCYLYNGCGGKYPIPVAPPQEEVQASTERVSHSEALLICAPQGEQTSSQQASFQPSTESGAAEGC
ncbi:hypothetical protein [Hyalangium rubrum]|uniref:Uncharacterized protein n=1 Tax=Hyalangium rubrum TaxID=3103134 RepID=A0ABU5H064_9BACT|nr:hypothetical protein [Hyalangium sp. s54d21]MDY7226509.1 hypothetical protein [Hyalangium sp. s54d21]